MKKIVNMNEADISNEEYPIIGTCALATCFGILLYEENKRIAIVGHSTADWVPIVLKMLDLIDDSEMSIFKYLVIPGYYSKIEDVYNTKKKIELFFEMFKTDKVSFKPYDKEYEEYIIFDEKTCSYEFDFDSRTGKFLLSKNNYIKK